MNVLQKNGVKWIVHRGTAPTVSKGIEIVFELQLLPPTIIGLYFSISRATNLKLLRYTDA